MQHEVNSQNTKKMLSASFRKFLGTTPLSKITVSEIIEDCSINRKTFYYHFADIYALLKWTVEQESFDVVKDFDLIHDYRKAVTFALDYIDHNERLINGILTSLTREEARNLFYDDFYTIISGAIAQTAACMDMTISKEFADFLSKMYTGIVAGLIIDWTISNDRDADRSRTTDYICAVFNEMLPHMIRTAYEKKL